MLMRMLRSLLGGTAATDGAAVAAHYPVEDTRRRMRLFENAPVDAHLDILFRDCRIGGLEFLPVYRACVDRSDTHVSAWKSFIRVQSALNLAHYFLHALDIPGRRIECGVFRGFSALLVCEVARAVRGYDGDGLHLVDSFAGFPAPRDEDFIPLRNRELAVKGPAFRAGDGAAPENHVRAVLGNFPRVTIHHGWIPEVYGALPDGAWSFVHIDVDLYEPTLASLEHFFPRMNTGGVIVCDDYGSALFPGAHLAWDAFCEARNLPFVVLETGQAVLLKS
jgi:hypothetical protein